METRVNNSDPAGQTHSARRKRKTAFVVMIVVVALLVGTAVLEETIGLPISAALDFSAMSSRYRHGEWHIITNNKRFFVEDLYLPGQVVPIHLVLHEQVRTDRAVNAEGSESTVTVDASGKQGQKAIKWRFVEPGHKGELEYPFYAVTHYGCCAEPTTRSFFGLQDGRKMYTTTANLFRINVPSDEGRFVTYDQQDETLGVLQYGSEGRVIGKIEIKTPENVGSPVISATYKGQEPDSQSLWLQPVHGDTSSTFSHITIVVNFYEGRELRFPLESDNIQLDKATIAQDFSASKPR